MSEEFEVEHKISNKDTDALLKHSQNTSDSFKTLKNIRFEINRFFLKKPLAFLSKKRPKLYYT